VTRSARPASSLALVVLLAGCGATIPATESSSPSSERPEVGAVAASGSSAGPLSGGLAGKPPASAAMMCDADIKSKIGEALSLSGPPPTEWRWSKRGVYTCDYHLPMGQMSLRVMILAGDSQARTMFDADQARTLGAQPLAGLGERAYGSEDGRVNVLKDNQILVVDATRLPQEFGANRQRRTDLAYEVASDVMGCWTGD
jgi:hypothetical protein